MRYTPYSEAEIQSMNVMDVGTYDFKVLDVITTNKDGSHLTDKNGNDMAKLKLLVWDNELRERIIFTYISGGGTFAFKLRHFAQSIGMLHEYENSEFNIHRALDKSGKAEIVIKKGTLKNDGSGEMWADRNDVKDFISVSDNNVNIPINRNSSIPASQIEDDEVPF